MSVSRRPSASSRKMICGATFEAMKAVVYTCCPAWIALSTPKLWLVTRCIRPGRISLSWGTDSIKSFFKGGKVWLHCFQCCHQCIWLWLNFLGLTTRTLKCLTWTSYGTNLIMLGSKLHSRTFKIQESRAWVDYGNGTVEQQEPLQSQEESSDVMVQP